MGTKSSGKGKPYPSVKVEQPSSVRVKCDLFSEPESKRHDEGPLYLPEVDQRGHGAASVLHQVHSADVLLTRQDINLHLSDAGAVDVIVQGTIPYGGAPTWAVQASVM